MKVYAVYFTNRYDEDTIQLLFSTRELAEEHISKKDKLIRSQYWVDEMYVYTEPLN